MKLSKETQRLVDQFVIMTKISSPSKQEGVLADYLHKELELLGFSVERDEAGAIIGGNTGNLIATLPGNGKGMPLAFCCHMDTVIPCENVHPHIDGDTIRSDRTTILGADDKAGIAAILEGIRRIREKNEQHGLLQVIFTICEEIGLYGAKHLDFDKIKASRVFVFDSNGPIGKIIVEAPAKDKIKVAIKGKSAHAGICPELGVSAIQVTADAISQMKLLRIDEKTTANIGTITAGSATNIVAEEALVIGEARSVSPERLALQTKHMTECFESAAKKFNALVDIEIEHCYQAFTLNEKDPAVMHCIKAMERLGIKPELQSTGGGSDCNIFNANGITAVDLAIGMTDVHTKEESIKIADLEMGARLVETLIESA